MPQAILLKDVEQLGPKGTVVDVSKGYLRNYLIPRKLAQPATKGAVTAFTKALAVDEAASGVRVNSVSPGNIYTPLWQEAIDAAPDPQRCRADGEAAQVMGRMGTAEEVGRLCLFIAAEATFTTGVDHIISGGAELGYGQKSRD